MRSVEVLDKIKREKMVAIFRGLHLDELLSKVELLLNYDLTVMEITLNSPSALETIEALKKRYGQAIELGAGTVTKPEEVKQVKDVGGTFIISPNMDKGVIKTTKELDMISIPGVMTPTEIQQASEYGADMLKIFPAKVMGLEYIKNLKGPFPQLSFMATGGVNEKNVHDFIESGYDSVGIGSSLTASQDDEDLKRQLEIYTQLKSL